jgi:hypothetical protein
MGGFALLFEKISLPIPLAHEPPIPALLSGARGALVARMPANMLGKWLAGSSNHPLEFAGRLHEILGG